MGLLGPRVRARITVPDVVKSCSPRSLPFCRPSSNMTAASPGPRRPPATYVYKGFWISASLGGPQRSPCLRVSDSELGWHLLTRLRATPPATFPVNSLLTSLACLLWGHWVFSSLFSETLPILELLTWRLCHSLSPGFSPVSLLLTGWWYHAQTTSFSYSLFLNALAFESQRSLPTLALAL